MLPHERLCQWLTLAALLRLGRNTRWLRVGLVVAVACTIATPQLAAQPSGPCAGTLDVAQSHYVQQEFEAAEVLLRECLTRADITSETRVGLWRLLALIHLQRADLVEARRTVLRILGESPSYTADPVQDPPTYVALVELVRDQLGMDGAPESTPPALEDSVEVAPPVEGPPPTEPLRPDAPEEKIGADSVTAVPLDSLRDRQPRRLGGAFEFSGIFGVGSYGGERGADEAGPLPEFVSNSGVTVALRGAYSPSPSWAVLLEYRFLDYPLARRTGVAGGDDDGASLHLASVLGRFTPWPASFDAPYLYLGIAGGLSTLAGDARLAVGPHAGVGLDVALTEHLGLFGEASAVLSFPGDALDGVSTRLDGSSGGGDVLTFVGLGVRYRTAAR